MESVNAVESCQEPLGPQHHTRVFAGVVESPPSRGAQRELFPLGGEGGCWASRHNVWATSGTRRGIPEKGLRTLWLVKWKAGEG